MKQIITKDKQIKCVTTIPYDKDTVKEMKKSGYKIKTVEDEKE